jgi:hypothetical protein
MKNKELVVEISSKQFIEQELNLENKAFVLVTPPINEDYWLFRVPLTEKQAIVAFPKFSTIGIGFQVEGADWNTNLPYGCPAEEIYEHIKENKGDNKITKQRCIKAIKLLQKIIQEKWETPAHKEIRLKMSKTVDTLKLNNIKIPSSFPIFLKSRLDTSSIE